MKMYRFFLFVLIILFWSCSAQNVKKEKINTKANKAYNASVKSFSGKLEKGEFQEIRKKIEAELNTEVPEDKSILINYRQNGKNCIGYEYTTESFERVVKNSQKISDRISKEHNIEDYFVYASDALNKEKYEKKEEFILDSGFFQQQIFTLQENCEAFYILKPNGEFLKSYGEDYYSRVEAFFE